MTLFEICLMKIYGRVIPRWRCSCLNHNRSCVHNFKINISVVNYNQTMYMYIYSLALKYLLNFVCDLSDAKKVNPNFIITDSEFDI